MVINRFTLKLAGAALSTFMISGLCNAQKIISEATLTYNISTRQDKLQADPLSGATNTIYLKGTISRTEMVSPLGKETTIYDTKTGTGVILKEYSGQKLMITLTRENWVSQNNKFEGITFTNTSETKIIGSYKCTKAIGKLKDGSIITVYYSPEIIINNKEYNQIFKNLSGLPVEYEFENGKMKFNYTLESANVGAVPNAKFDTPKAGYRVMSYDESRQGRKEGN